MAASNAEARLLPKLAELRKKALADIGTKTGDIGTADVFTRLVQFHRNQRYS